MPGRNHIFTEGAYYHIYSKTIDGKRPFDSSRNSQIFLHMMWFYRAQKVGVSHSRFLGLPPTSQSIFIPTINDPEKSNVTVLAYCLMPTHYHMLIREKKKGGVSAYMSKVQNAFTRFYNLKSRRSGQLFRGRFKSKPIGSEEIFRHIARYIHLNPYSSQVVRKMDELKTYPSSSMRELFVSDKLKSTLTTDVDLLLSFFGDKVSNYLKFVKDQADYQRTLEHCKSIEKSISKQ